MSPSFTGWLFWRWNTAITLPATSRTVVGRASGCRLGSSTGVPCQPWAAPQMRGATPTTMAPNSSAAASVTSASREIQVAARIDTTLTAGPATFGSRDRYVAGRDEHSASVPLRRAAPWHRRRRRRLGGDRPQARGPRLRHGDDARPLHRPAGTGAGAHRGRRGHHHLACRRARVRQRLPAPGRARQGAGDDGRAVGRARRDRPRGRVDGERLRAVGDRPRARRACASTASRRRSPSSAV